MSLRALPSPIAIIQLKRSAMSDFKMESLGQPFSCLNRHPTPTTLLIGMCFLHVNSPRDLLKEAEYQTYYHRSRAFKVYVTLLICVALTWINFFAGGPGAVLVEIAIDLFGVYPPDSQNPATLSPMSIAAFSSAVSKTALLFSTASMVAGVSNLLWVPLAVKYGRRVVYTSSFLVFGLCCIWSARATSYGILLASRIIAAWFSGSAECVAPMTIADIFFLHERGKMTAYVRKSMAMH